MTATTGASETWQARIGNSLRAALDLLHRRAAEERMGRSIDDFYGNQAPPLPVGVRPGPAAGAPDGADGAA